MRVLLYVRSAIFKVKRNTEKVVYRLFVCLLLFVCLYIPFYLFVCCMLVLPINVCVVFV